MSRLDHILRGTGLVLALSVLPFVPAAAKKPAVAARCPDSAGNAAMPAADEFKLETAPRIFKALGADRHAALRALLAAGENPNLCHAGMTPLLLAVASGDVAAIGMLLDAGALVDRPRDANGATPLHYALSAPQFAAAALLLERGADAGAIDDGRKTTLHSLALQPPPAPALRAAQITLAGRLLRQNVAIDALHIQGSSALGMAIASGNLALTTYLLEQGANPNLPNKRGETALAQARRLGNSAMVTLLERHPAVTAAKMPAAAAHRNK